MADQQTTDPNPQAAPAPTPTGLAGVLAWAKRNHAFVAWVWSVIISAAWAVQYYRGERADLPPLPPPPPPLVEQSKAPPVAATGAGEFTPTFGWVEDATTIAANLDPEKTLHFDATPAGKATLGDDDTYLWRAVRKVNNKGPPWYPNVNQQSVGCCVGCGWKQSADVCLAVQAATKGGEWKALAVEPIYGGSRVEVGGGRISGDGSTGAWAAEWCKTRGGVAPMAKYTSYDLTEFSPTRAREFGRKGVPDDIEAVCKTHMVKGTALVRSWADVKKAIAQGYPVAVCSNQGFRMERDSTGRCRPQGVWPHCMAIIGTRSGDNEGGFVLNSWGDNAHTGPRWPDDAPAAGFWADASVIDRMVRQADSFALADVAGFPARKLDLFILAPRDRLRDLARRPDPVLAF